MPSIGSPPSFPKTPSRTAQMEIQNRISLATSRMSFLQKYRSKQQHQSAATQMAASGTTKPLSFSSLAGKGRLATARSNITATAATEANGDDNDDDELPLRAMADPNTGLGHIAKPAAAITASRQDDKLRARLVGRQQKGGSDSVATKRQRNEDSSEDDEPGRSGLGRSKKPKRNSRQEEQSNDKEDARSDCTPRQAVVVGNCNKPRQQHNDDDAQDGNEVMINEKLGSNDADQPLMQGPKTVRAEASLNRVQDEAKDVSSPAEVNSQASSAAALIKRRKKKQNRSKIQDNLAH